MAKKQHTPPAGEKPATKFRVHLHANSPIAHRTAEVEAATPEDAWGKFCELNGISDSVCEREITPIE